MAPFITNDLNPTPPKIGGDDIFEPAVMRGAGVVNMLLYFLFVHKERNMWDQFSHLIVSVSVLHVVGTLGMLMALVKKSFSFWVETFSFYQRKWIFSPLDLTSWHP